MKKICACLTVGLLTLCLAKPAYSQNPQNIKDTATVPYISGIRIGWDYSTLRAVSAGPGYHGYARMIQLADQSLMCTYEWAGSIVVVKSADHGNSWSAPIMVDAKADGINMAVPDIIQLKDGSIMVCYNPRPYQIAPERKFGIRTKKSYDNGLTWTDARLVYEADYLFQNGCWEPSAIQLPNGEIQLFFANESLYRQSDEQNISMLRSADNGLSWTKTPQIASFRAGARDGMPVPILLKNGKEIAFAIEDNGFTNFKPYIIKNLLTDNWAQPVTAASSNRSYALAQKIADSIYAGAPYLRQLPSGETILSYQGTEGRRNQLNFSEMKVAIGNDQAGEFNRKSVPFDIPANKSGLWNSLSVIDGNTVVALTSTNGLSQNGPAQIWMIKGHVIPQLIAGQQNINIDNNFNSPIWQTPFPVFVGHKSPTQARAKIIYDANFLYILTKVTDSHLSINKNTPEESDGTSIFVHNKNQTYHTINKAIFMICVSADNRVTVKEGANGNWVKRGNGAIKTATLKTASGYSQKIAIPWVMLGGKPRLNAAMGINLGLTENTGTPATSYTETVTTCLPTHPESWMPLIIK